MTPPRTPRARIAALALAAALVACAPASESADPTTTAAAEASALPPAAPSVPWTAHVRALGERLVRESAQSPVWPPKPDLLRVRSPWVSRGSWSVPAPCRTVMLAGASTMQWAVGRAIERALTPWDVRVVNVARSATGLSRPDYIDWNVRAEQAVKEHRPDLVILQFGGNDCQSLFDPEGNVIVDFDDRRAWRRELYRRMDHLVGILASRGATVVLLDLQPMQSTSHHRCVADMNRLAARVAEAWQFPYLSVQQVVGTPEGEYLETMEFRGRTVRLRATDGLHLTTAGGDVVAAHVEQLVAALPDWPVDCEHAPRPAPVKASDEGSGAPQNAETP